MRLVKYLKGSHDLCLVLGGLDAELHAYSDADWASSADRKSISGFAVFRGYGCISWSSKKQPIIALSSTESEYIALTHLTKDVLWTRKLLTDLHEPPSEATPVYCDNQGAIRLTKDSAFHARTKHIDIRFHFIRQTAERGDIIVHDCRTDDMIADIFTKPLGRVKFEKFRFLLGMESHAA